ncbi:hypothetical protein CXQ85_004779 [Candidozyma haemuli]|uniref:GPI ethanolamine phosphate transferase 2 n=1 Tax=Candidozyma haemuli TaxID=45357 RepID=A0A2V1AVH0_9ASCO|nr:hypothetical protein CXQ85_004779 [[Candida] haemuloni]PVH22110.1 hypothetical protein CXQ85_004779 [[Candida] haemuloni]
MEGAFESESGNAQFEKIILIVVDALRSDFMFSNSSSMTFLQELIETGSALPFTAYSNPPTVTLPRLKGITTGQIPSFVDAILNVADDKDNSQGLSNTDSWVGQFLRQSKDRKINFFGDDTWLKLFPPNEFFNQSEGTSSFFVNDFTEVDRNVSRHLERQLKEDFDGLILHYLGVDHIGHTGGPNSLHMPIKLKEMDDVLKMMYESTLDDDDSTLVVIMGDHGMNEVDPPELARLVMDSSDYCMYKCANSQWKAIDDNHLDQNVVSIRSDHGNLHTSIKSVAKPHRWQAASFLVRVHHSAQDG